MSHPPQLWITIPAKPLAEGKSRLAAALNGQERLALTRRLVQHTLAIALSVTGVAGVLVVSRDPDILLMAGEAGASPVREAEVNGMSGKSGQEWGLNRAIEQAAAFVRGQGGDALLFLPTDLPLLQADDIHSILRAWGQRRDCVVLAPSRDGGTNALLLSPADAIRPAFGAGSFARHRRLAEEKALSIGVVESEGLAWDVDTPEEYRLLAALS